MQPRQRGRTFLSQFRQSGRTLLPLRGKKTGPLRPRLKLFNKPDANWVAVFFVSAGSHSRQNAENDIANADSN